MKITHVEAMVLKAPVEGISRWRAASFAVPFRFAETTLVKVTTDAGIVGWGEVHAPVAPEVTKATVDVLLAPALTGKDPLQVGVLWDEMYALMRPRGHSTGFMLEAMSGVDIALWDIAGKALNVPIYTLLGGAHRRTIPTYASILHWVDPPDLARLAAGYREQGFKAIKIKLGQEPRIDRDKILQVRAAVGDDVRLMADANCRYTVAEAKAMARSLEEHGFAWLEEPVPPEDIRGYQELRRAVDVAIAGGECECTHYRFAHLLDLGVYDVAQPDICRAGGITACHRIGLLADARNVPVAPHVSIGSAIHIAASVHWAAAAKNLLIHEYPVFPNPLVDDLLETPLRWEEGVLHLPEGPGLGVQVREPVVARYRTA